MEKSIYVQKVSESNQEHGDSVFYHLYEVDGYQYKRFANVEVYASKVDGEEYTYINGKNSGQNFAEYLSKLSKTNEIDLDSEIEEEFGFLNQRAEIMTENTGFGVIASESFSALNRGLHREDGPAVTEYYEDGTKKKEEWYRNDLLHREDGPAQIEYLSDGAAWSEVWYNQGRLHRLGGPAVTQYHDDGSVNIEIWYVENERHRLDGPAEIYYDEDGLIDVASYYIDGEELSESNFAATASKIIKQAKSSPEKSRDKPKHRGPSL